MTTPFGNSKRRNHEVSTTSAHTLGQDLFDYLAFVLARAQQWERQGGGIITLAILHSWSSVRGSRISRVLLLHVLLLSRVVLKLLDSSTSRSLVLVGNCRARLVTDWRKLNCTRWCIARLRTISVLPIDRHDTSTGPVVFSLACVIILLLACLPLLSNLFEFCLP